MFEVSVGDRLYRVCFEYYRDESRDPRDWDEDTEVFQMVRYTRANLYLMQGGEKLLVAFADTACATIDNFIKEVGRKHALGRLLTVDYGTTRTPENMKLISVLNWEFLPDFGDKALRSAFWSAYFGRQMDDRVKNIVPPEVGPSPVYLAFRKADAELVIAGMEVKYSMSFAEFSRSIMDGKYAQEFFSQEMEQDFWKWERADTLLRYYANVQVGEWGAFKDWSIKAIQKIDAEAIKQRVGDIP
jgi:hypothetical protein